MSLSRDIEQIPTHLRRMGLGLTSITLSCLLLLQLPVPLASAQTANDIAALQFRVSPQVRYLRVAPGTEQTIDIELTQSGDVPLRITPELRRFIPSGDGRGITFDTSQDLSFATLTLPQSTASSTAAATTATADSFFLDPGQRETVTLRLAPPAGVSGEYPLTVLFTGRSSAESAVGVSGTIGSTIITTVQPYEDDRAALSLAAIDAPRFVDSFGSIDFTVMARNEGTNASFASGSATVRGLTGSTSFPFEADMILSGYTRLLRSKTDTAPTTLTLMNSQDVTPPSTASAVQQMRYDAPFLLGPYRIEATLRRNAQTEEWVTERRTVIAAPFSLLFIGMFGGILWFCWQYVYEKK